MKTVGIILRDYISLSHNRLSGFRNDLLSFLRKYPINVICIPIDFEEDSDIELERVKKIISYCDGIIIPGGQNYYEIDLKIVNYLHKNNIPTLGICLGMQVMSLAFDGDIERLNDYNHQSKNTYVHNIKINTNSNLYNILKDKQIKVNSRHSEHITTTDLSIVAISDDLVIEAVEDANKTFFIGVQWHPESLINDIYSKKLFDFYINSL